MSKGRGHAWVWWVVGVVVIVAIGLAARPRTPAGQQVSIGKVKESSFTREVSGSGSVEAKIYTLSFNGSGKVKEVFVKEGDHVAAGTVLAMMDTAELSQSLGAAQARLAALRMNTTARATDSHVMRAKVHNSLGEARAKLAMTRKLYDIGAASREEVTNLEHQVANLEADLRASTVNEASTQHELRGQIAALQAEISGYQRSLKEAKLTSEVKGTIATVNMRSGEMATDLRVAQSAQGIIKVVEDHTMQVRVRLSEADAIEVQPGQRATVELDASPDDMLDAVVADLGVVAEVQGNGGSSTMPMILHFTDAAAAAKLAKPGFNATVRIRVRHTPKALVVPLDTVIEEEDKGKKLSYVWVIDPVTRKVKKTAFTILTRGLTEATAEGLQPGMLLVSLPSDKLKDDTVVRYTDPDDEKNAAGKAKKKNWWERGDKPKDAK